MTHKATNADDFGQRLAQAAALVERALADLFDGSARAGEHPRPEPLMAAVRHGALNGGKRLRPFLVLESTALFGGSPQAALRIAAALECMHCYSLVHDDLPAMDDDDLRRGQPTVHKAYDEATAILAGDVLLTEAFDIVCAPETPLDGETRARLATLLARAAGAGGMAGGQALDLAAERQAPDEAGVETLQAMKTGALIRFACEAGAVIAGATESDRARMARFGAAFGLAFQLADDLLDLTADTVAMGKRTGKDAGRGKATIPGMIGIEAARARLENTVQSAVAELAPFGNRATVLAEAVRFAASRGH